MRRIRTLDGWRGIAIAMVVVSHAVGSTRWRSTNAAVLGLLGVDIFFVLSGYIITRTLLEEADATGGIDLRAFYRRRVFRILPVAMLYLMVLCLLARVVNLVDFSWREVAASAFFFRNYWAAMHPWSGTYTGHFWSLSLEEHFYVFWPVLLYGLGRRRAAWVAAGLTAGCNAWRWIAHGIWPETWAFQTMRTDLRVDGILLGSLIAIVLAEPKVRAFVYRNFPKETPLLCGFPLVVSFVMSGGRPSLLTFAVIGVAIVSTVVVEEGLAHKWLNAGWLVWVGTISYSLYVWQQVVCRQPTDAIHPLGWLSKTPWNVGVALVLATLSYYAVERPMMALGKRLGERVQSEEPAILAEIC